MAHRSCGSGLGCTPLRHSWYVAVRSAFCSPNIRPDLERSLGGRNIAVRRGALELMLGAIDRGGNVAVRGMVGRGVCVKLACDRRCIGVVRW